MVLTGKSPLQTWLFLQGYIISFHQSRLALLAQYSPVVALGVRDPYASNLKAAHKRNKSGRAGAKEFEDKGGDYENHSQLFLTPVLNILSGHMDALYIILRYIHVGAATAWVGEVIVINFVLIPFVGSLTEEKKAVVIQNLFPRIFRLASVLSATALVAGYILLYRRIDGDISLLFANASSTALAIGAILGTVLTLFHFFMENKMAQKIGISKEKTELVEDIHTKLKIVPRLGMLVILTTFVLMMYSVRSI